MKKLFTLTALALLVLSVSAQLGQSVLNLRMSDRSMFKVVIDGQPSGPTDKQFRISGLRGGEHFKQIYKMGNLWGGHHNGHGYGYENSYPVFSGRIVLTANAESWVTVYPELHKVMFDDIRAFTDPCNPNKLDSRYPKIPVRDLCEINQISQCPATPFIPAGPVAMGAVDFTQLKQTIDNASFESTRLNILKQALNYNYFTTAQVRELIDLFWFENSKVEVAKLAYEKTIDQNNYYLVNNHFSYSSSVSELGNYIAMR